MTDETLRSVRLDRLGLGRYRATNVRGGTLDFGGDDGEFSPVELLLVALGGCTAADVDYITVKRAEPQAFRVTVTGDKIRDEHGNRMANLAVTFDVAFPDGPGGDEAREVLPQAIVKSHDRLCTVSRTIQLGAPIDERIAGRP